MDCILALDTGGTKCDALLLEHGGRILGWGHSCLPGVGGRSASAVREAVLAALSKEEPTIERLHSVVLGAMVPLSVFFRIKADTVELLPTTEWDVALTHAGLDHGAVIHAGTGSFVHVKTPAGPGRHLDGGGPILGDFGSGYHLGLLAIQAAFRAHWHKRHATALLERVHDLVQGAFPSYLPEMTVFFQDRSVVASLARAVTEEAENGDAVARRIVAEAVDALAETFRDGTTDLGVDQDGYGVVGTGGMIRNCALYREALWERVRAIAPRSEPICLTQPPVVSMAIYALQKLLGTAAPPAIGRLTAQATRCKPRLFDDVRDS